MQNDNEAKRTEFMGFYATEAEKQAISKGATSRGMSVSGYLRWLALYKDKEG